MQFVENCSPWGGPIGEAHEGLSPVGGTPEESSPESEGLAEACDELIEIPIPCPLALLEVSR